MHVPGANMVQKHKKCLYYNEETRGKGGKYLVGL